MDSLSILETYAQRMDKNSGSNPKVREAHEKFSKSSAEGLAQDLANDINILGGFLQYPEWNEKIVRKVGNREQWDRYVSLMDSQLSRFTDQEIEETVVPDLKQQWSDLKERMAARLEEMSNKRQ